jgi:hypothetical protein
MTFNRIGGVMVNMLTWNAIDRGFDTSSGKTKRVGVVQIGPHHLIDN